MLNLVFDRCVNGNPYPNLAEEKELDNGYHGIGDEYPWIAPFRPLYYAKDHNYPVTIYYTGDDIPANSFYPIGLAFFSFDVDYFALLSDTVKDLCRQSKLRILFYYHEGDSPYYEKEQLDYLCQQHNMPVNCYRFVSGNTEASKIPGFVYFPDHELFYWRNSVVWNNQPMPGCEIHTNPRSKKFTALSRVHKWWRATIMTYLKRQGVLAESYWSYNDVSINDQFDDNPIQIDMFMNLRQELDAFVQGMPYICDTKDTDEQNSHWRYTPYLFDDSYCHLVLETLFDAEQSGGAFLSEKTFKPMRHGQPFIVFGTPGTLRTLRELGYKTFDSQIESEYDNEFHNTKRFVKIINAIRGIQRQDMDEWFKSCLNDIKHNQQVFLASKYNRLEMLVNKLSV